MVRIPQLMSEDISASLEEDTAVANNVLQEIRKLQERIFC